MNLYQNYCYPDIQTVADNLQSQAFIPGYGLIASASPVSATQISLGLTLADGSSSSVVLTFPACFQLGFQNSYSGISLADSIELSGLCLLILATAYSIKILRRGI